LSYSEAGAYAETMSERTAPAEPTAADYARELDRGTAWLRFEPGVEAEFRRSHTLRVRTQARFWQVLQVVIGIVAINAILGGAGAGNARGLLLACLVVHLVVSAILVSRAFGSSYASTYLETAAALTPFRSAAFAIIVANIIDTGGSGTAALTINLFGLLFFSGLLLRQALPAATVMIAAFVAALAAFDVPGPLAAYSVTSLLIVFGLAGFVAWDMQRQARTAFLEHGLTRADATRDALTGLVNRRHFDARLAELWNACGQRRQPLTAMLVDVDHFKAFNDGYGHQAGDETLRRVAQALQSEAGAGPVVARFGGEEMAVLAAGLDEHEAEALAGRLRRAVEALAIPHAGSPNFGVVTVSVGGTCIVPLPGRSAPGVLQLADENLYAAKRSGRNRVVFHQGAYEQMRTGVFRHAGAGKTP
jgi:diguanylate cyclase (GGDEF)-like protein